MSPTVFMLIAFESFLLFVFGLVVGFFMGNSQNISDESEHFGESIKLWRDAVDKIDELTRRDVVQLGSIRERLVDLRQSVDAKHFEEPLDGLTEQVRFLEKDIQNLKLCSETVRDSALGHKRWSTSDTISTTASQDMGSGDFESSYYSFDDFITGVAKQVDFDVPLNSLLEFVYQELRRFVPCQRMGYAEIDYDTDRVSAAWYRSERPGRLIGGYSAALSTSSLRLLVAKQQPRVLNNLPEYLRRHPDSDSTRLIVSEGYRSSLTLPVVSKGSVVAFLFLSNIDADSFDDEAVILAQEVVKQIGHSIYLPRKSCSTESVLI